MVDHKMARKVQIDNSSTATHQLSRGKREHGINQRFVVLLDHFGMKPRTINIGATSENADVESSHRPLREHLDAQLTFRGHRDFESHESWQSFIDKAVDERNAERSPEAEREKSALRSLPPVFLPELDETFTRVNKHGLPRVGKHGYSIPRVGVGAAMRVCVYDPRLEFHHAGIRGCPRPYRRTQHLLQRRIPRICALNCTFTTT